MMESVKKSGVICGIFDIKEMIDWNFVESCLKNYLMGLGIVGKFFNILKRFLLYFLIMKKFKVKKL